MQANYLSVILSVTLGALLTYFPSIWVEKRKERQRKNNLSKFIEIDIETLKNAFEDLTKLISIPETLNTIFQILNTISENLDNRFSISKSKSDELDQFFHSLDKDIYKTEIKGPTDMQIALFHVIDNAKSYILSLIEKRHFLINVHSNIFAGFDSYIVKELGNISHDIAKEVNRFYFDAKVFCDTSKNCVESIKNLNLQIELIIARLNKAIDDRDEKTFKYNLQILASLFKDFKSVLELLESLYNQIEQKRQNILEHLKNEKIKTD